MKAAGCEDSVTDDHLYGPQGTRLLRENNVYQNQAVCNADSYAWFAVLSFYLGRIKRH